MQAEDPELELLRLLADGELHSGQALAGALGLTRAAVWKRADRLGALGIRLERTRSRGYRLERPLELLDVAQIRAAIPAGLTDQIGEVRVHSSIPSTNELASSLLRRGEMAHSDVVLAEHQSRGKGRRGRDWTSPFGCNLYLSLVWTFAAGIAALGGLSLVVGLGIVRALRREAAEGVALKWPNDIVAEGAKLGGVLIEIEGDVQGPVTVVIGIGVNVDMPREAAREIDQRWTDLRRICAVTPSRNRVAGRIVGECAAILSEFSGRSFPDFRAEWERVDALRGKRVSVSTASGNVTGIAQGVDAEGALVVDVEGERRTIVAGDVSVRAIR